MEGASFALHLDKHSFHNAQGPGRSFRSITAPPRRLASRQREAARVNDTKDPTPTDCHLGCLDVEAKF